MREGQATDVIGPEPHTYSINLDGFKNNREEFFLSPADLEIEASKPEPWVGDLTVVLKVNGKIVDCITNSKVRSGGPDTYSVTFDADNREDYEGDFGCRLNLWFF